MEHIAVHIEQAVGQAAILAAEFLIPMEPARRTAAHIDITRLARIAFSGEAEEVRQCNNSLPLYLPSYAQSAA